MLPRLSKLVLGGVIKTIGLEAAKQKAKWRTVKRQWALTVGKRAYSGILDVHERSVDLEHVSDMLCSLKSELVVVETANGSGMQASAGPDGRETACGGVLERCESPVLSETL